MWIDKWFNNNVGIRLCFYNYIDLIEIKVLLLLKEVLYNIINVELCMWNKNIIDKKKFGKVIMM